MKRKLLLILALLIFIGTESWGQRFAPPGGGGGGIGGEVTVSLSPSSLTMTVGEGATVICTISGAMGLSDVTWEVVEGVGNIIIFKELNECHVTALQAGSATIQATSGGKTATCAVTVNPLTLTAKEGATGEYWATYYNDMMGFTADDNTTVFQAALSGDQLTLTPVANRIIPAGNAVILKSSAETITLTMSSTSATLSANQLQGTTAEMTGAEGNIYVLNKGTNGVGFYKLKSTGTIGANKAYLTYSGGAGAREFFLFDETTGIISVNGSGLMVNGSDGCYDLQGRRVVNPTNGLYIVNGKKVFINK